MDPIAKRLEELSGSRRAVVGRRYAPLVLLAAVQLILVLMLPSTAPRLTGVAAGGDGDTASTGRSSLDGAGAGPGVTAVEGGAGAGPGGGGAGSTGAAGARGGSSSGARAGDTSHCVAGRQYDPAIDYYAPPCVPKWTGTDNGGATYQGVTKDSIKIIEYMPKVDPAIQSIAQAAGLYTPPEALQAYRDAMTKFINSRFELYGRKVKLETADGTCSITPPDVACLRNDFRRIIKDQQPFTIVWAVPGCSACFDEMSQNRTLNVGGLYFTDEFSQARAPYHWDVQQSGTYMNRAMGQFWCANLAKQPAAYALHVTGSMNGKPRKLGVIGPNDPQMQATVQAAKTELAKCGDTIAAEYYYAADLTTAAQQVQAGIAKMQAAGVTSIYYLADIAGPGYFMGGQQNQNYYAENIMTGAGTQDNDDSGQELQSNPIACPKGPPCPFTTSFGLLTSVYEPLTNDAGRRVWKAAGNSGNPPYARVTFMWDYYSLIATMIQASGPELTPRNVDLGVRAYGLRGDATHALRGFPTGSYTWGQDMGMQYWNKDLKSPYNDAVGSYVVVGSRSVLGGWKAGGLGSLPNRG